MEKKHKINFVVTDLDDTLWDWLSMWYYSFSPYLDRIAQEFNLDKELLKLEFKKVHQKYHTAESSFIYHDIELINDEQKGIFENNTLEKRSIIHEYNSNKKNNLKLFDDVLSTLENIKKSGALIVGFTESNSFFTKYRIKHLKLDGILNCVYAPKDFDLPPSVIRHYKDDSWEPEKTAFKYLERNTRKPAPEILEIIIKEFKALPNNTIYIGDKLDKDISMANHANIKSVHAAYGHRIESKAYELLRDVTHWSEEEVEREKEFKKNNQTDSIANYTLEKSLKELFNYFEFNSFH